MGRNLAIDQFSEKGEFIQTWPSISLAAISLDVWSTSIIRALDHDTETVSGFMWKTSLDQQTERVHKLKCIYTEEQRLDFEARVKRHMPIIYNLLNKTFSFVDFRERQDYAQEALMYAWIQFYTYRASVGDAARFGAWFKITCRWGMYAYLEKTKKYRNSLQYGEFDDLTKDFSDDTDANDQITNTIAVYHCLEDLPEKFKRIMYGVMEDKDPNEAYQDMGISRDNYFKSKAMALAMMKSSMDYYLFGIKDSRRRIECRRGPVATPIEQYDLQGKLIASFTSIGATADMGFDPREVSKVINNRRKKYRDFIWKPAKPEQVEFKTRHSNEN